MLEKITNAAAREPPGPNSGCDEPDTGAACMHGRIRHQVPSLARVILPAR
jgi:hypothetical protein